MKLNNNICGLERLMIDKKKEKPYLFYRTHHQLDMHKSSKQALKVELPNLRSNK